MYANVTDISLLYVELVVLAVYCLSGMHSDSRWLYVDWQL